MNNPLLDVPLNLKRVFVKAITPTGCEVYMPVDSFDETVQDAKKIALQIYLNKDEFELPPPTLRSA